MRKNLQHLEIPVNKKLENNTVFKDKDLLLKKTKYSTKDIEGFNYLHSSSGTPPYLRGTSTLMHTQNPLPITHSIAFLTNQEGNTLLKKATLNNLSVFYLNPKKELFNTLNDVKTLFKDIDITNKTFYIPCNNAMITTIALFIVYAEQQSLNLEKLDIKFINSNSKNWSKEGAGIMLDIFNYLSKKTSKIKLLNTYTVNQSKENTAHAHIVSIITKGLLNINKAIQNNITIDQFAASLVFNYNPELNIFLETAKIRAARMLWVKCLETYKPKNQNSFKLKLHAIINAKNNLLTTNNITKQTIKASIANIAGVDCVINSTENKTALIVQEETGINKTIDALGGSYYIETLTNKLANKAWPLICKHNNATPHNYKINAKQNQLEKAKQNLALLTEKTNLNKQTNFLELAINAVKNGATARTINISLRP